MCENHGSKEAFGDLKKEVDFDDKKKPVETHRSGTTAETEKKDFGGLGDEVEFSDKTREVSGAEGTKPETGEEPFGDLKKKTGEWSDKPGTSRPSKVNQSR